MKAAQLTGLRQMEIRDVTDPEIAADDDVLIRMGAVGVCGSDVHYYETGNLGGRHVEYPFSVGHEGSGTVAAVGPAVTRVRPGDRVAVEPAIVCGACDQCRAGRPNTCRKIRFLGCPGEAAGCLSERLVMPERNCFPIPDGMSLETAAFCEPLSIGIYAADRSVELAGATAVILGAGPIGLSVMAAARTRGPKAIYATDKIDARLAVAGAAGAAWTGNPDVQDVVAAIREREPLGVDVVFECCGRQEAIDQAVQLLKPGGKLVVLGIPEVERYTIDTTAFRHNELTLFYVRRQNERVSAALELAGSGRLDVTPFVTHRFPLARAAEAFELVSAYRDGVVKAMILME